jgi:TIGR03009 family protein
MPLSRFFVGLSLLTVCLTPTAGLSQAPAARQPGQVPERVEAGRPFPPLAQAAQARLDQLLAKWEAESNDTKLLSCDFTRWHYDNAAAPAGIHATWSQGSIKYASPDKGMFRVDTHRVFKGLTADNKPIFDADEKNLGEYWVCNGTELLEFDRVKKQCVVQVIPPEMRGKEIFESPLPFVFNLDAKEIQERYWVREVQPPPGKTGVYVIEAHPKRQEDRSQYLFVTIVIGAKTFMPEELIMYAPNFNLQTAPVWDHYSFTSVSRNGLISNIESFTNSFIKARPPADWEIIRQPLGGAAAPQQAAAPTDDNPVR